MDFVSGLVAKCHVGYIVDDVDSALKNLQEKLGCALEAKSYLFKPLKAWTDDVPVDDFSLKIVICRIKDNMTFEYIQPISKEGYHFSALVSNGTHINHICFATEDFDGYRAEFRKMGAKFLFEAEANDPQNGYRRCFYAQLDGIPGVFEILENAKPYVNI